MKKIYQNEVLKWSNLFFLIPLLVAVVYGLYWYALILLAVFIVSFDFHFLHEAKKMYYFDIVFSSILMLSNFVLLFKGHWVLPHSAIAVAFALFALFFYFRKKKHDYYFNHSLWHIFSAGICLFCLLTLFAFI